ncbi:hypothetical protein MA16_Dca021810 [Dendrobium catenatum]|uniref:Uncharacterized protein n=1 Tax=Dendrobium catenatum TaxID=906689 RepID=A0A2I0VPL7_9ASPA|nr:hypothetical protein MA16_Dca021810 [Dendrobium catenatum]
MDRRSPSDVGTGGWPKVQLREGCRELSSKLARTDRWGSLGCWGKTHLPRAWTAGIDRGEGGLGLMQGGRGQRPRELVSFQPVSHSLWKALCQDRLGGTTGACSPLALTVTGRGLGRVDLERAMGTC